jgi:hypothetical protein
VERAISVALEAGLPYSGLRDFEPDQRLFLYLPLELAQRERVVPLVLVGDALKIASEHPRPDLSLLSERFPALTVDIVISPPSEIAAALERAQIAAQ